MRGPMVPVFAFWIILAVGLYLKELSVKVALVFVGVYFAGIYAFSLISDHGAWQIIPVVLVDVVLLLKVLGGDVKIR